MDDAALLIVLYIVGWAIGVIITLWILWAIIRSAVLSALRKHTEENLERGIRHPR